MKERDLDYLESARSRGEAGLRHRGAGERQHAVELLRRRPATHRLPGGEERLRRGALFAGMHIPVVMEDELPAPPDVYYVLAWNFKNEILANNRRLLDRGVQFYFRYRNPSVML